MLRKGNGTLSIACVGGIAAACFMALVLMNPSSAFSASCSSQTQSVKKRMNVSCQKAKKVDRRARNAGVAIPECPSTPNAHWRGWKIKAVSSGVIKTRFSKGNRSFLMVGGGACF